jgi:TolB protein
MQRSLLRLALLLAAPAALVALLWPRPSEADRLVVDVSKPGGKDLPLALPLPEGDGSVSDEFWKTVWRDLEISGYFHLVDPDAYIEPASAGVEPGTFDYKDWEISDTVVLAKSKLGESGGKLRAEIWVYDVPGTRKLGAKAFSGTPDQARRLAHKVADEILLQVTGKAGIFNTRFAAVNSGTGNKEIYLVDIDGEGVVQLTRNRSINLQPAWSPNGNAVVFTSYRSGNPDLYVADLDNGRTHRLSSRPGLNTGGAWSPAGNLIALTLTAGSDTDIFTIDPYAGKEVAQLTRGNGIDVSPSWSPDGARIAFASDRTGGPQIYVMDAGGGGAERVTFQGSYNTDPAFSPDGETVAYVTRGEDGSFDIMTVKVDGSEPRRITQLQGANEDPSWSPDGRYLAFTSTRTGSGQIWVSTSDGRHQTQITRGYGGWSNPSWSPELMW